MVTHSSILAWEIAWTRGACLLGYRPQGHKESDTTEDAHTHAPITVALRMS